MSNVHGKLFDRVRVATATVGTGTVTTGAADSGYQTWANAGAVNNDWVAYVIEDGTAWEVGFGQYGSAGPTITRNLIQSSTGSLISLSGSAKIFSAANYRHVLNSPHGVALCFANGVVAM